jgi:hypothetical protein
LGYLFEESSRSVRAVSGVPGAASLERPESLGQAVERAWITPRGQVIFAGKLAGSLEWRDLATGRTKPLPAARLVAISPNGRYAALATASAIELWRLTPEPEWEKSFVAAVTAVAVSDRAEVAALRGQDLLWFGDTTLTAALSRPPVDLAFAPDSSDLAIATAGALVLRTANGLREIEIAAAGPVAGLSGGAWLVAGVQTLWLVDAAFTAREIPCDCEPLQLARLAPDVFHLTARAETLVLLVDAARAQVARLAPSVEPTPAGGVQ